MSASVNLTLLSFILTSFPLQYGIILEDDRYMLETLKKLPQAKVDAISRPFIIIPMHNVVFLSLKFTRSCLWISSTESFSFFLSLCWDEADTAILNEIVKKINQFSAICSKCLVAFFKSTFKNTRQNFEKRVFKNRTHC